MANSPLSSYPLCLAIRKTMMAAELVTRIYVEMGLPAPEVIEFPTLTDALRNFTAWRPRIRRFSAVLWDYQYPVLHPGSYWARFHLFDEGFQFDLSRTANARACYCYPQYHSTIPIAPKFLFSAYVDGIVDSAQHNVPNALDLAISTAFDSHADVFDALRQMQCDEDPTSQADIESQVFLAPQSWVHFECALLRHMRSLVRMPVCDEHYQNVKLLSQHDGLFLTFGNLVISTQIDGPAAPRHETSVPRPGISD